MGKQTVQRGVNIGNVNTVTHKKKHASFKKRRKCGCVRMGYNHSIKKTSKETDKETDRQTDRQTK